MAVDGQFQEAYGQAPGRFTLRQHVRRHTWFSPFFDWLLNFLMGQDIDTPTTVWDELFLPQEFGNRILEFSYVDSGGQRQQLVSGVESLNRALGRPRILDAPRRQWVRELALGLVIAAFFAFLLLFGNRRIPDGKAADGIQAASVCRAVSGISQAALGLFFGVAGLTLFFMTFFTNHDYTWHNSNVLFVNPLILAAIPLGILYASAKTPQKRLFPGHLLRALWTYVFLGGILSMVIKLFPGFYQQNQVTQALVLPFAFTLSFFPGWIGRLFRR
jgi:hypothetical protein